MNRQPLSGADVAVTLDLDSGFIGVDNRRDPGALAAGGAGGDPSDVLSGPGLLSDAENVRMRNGYVETRPGCCEPPHFNPEDLRNIQGAGVFSDPAGREYLLVADVTRVWRLADGLTPVSIALPEPLTGPVEFVQTFHHVVMFRSGGLPPLEWDGDWRHPFQPVRQSTPGPNDVAFLEPIPAADWGVVMADRLFVPAGRDTIGWSDVLDFTRWDPVLAQARFNQGEDDAIVAAAPYQGNRLIVFKTQSIYWLDNVYGDMSEIRVDRLPTKVGCLARKTVQAVGYDLLWLDRGGVYRLSQTEQGALRGVPIPVSRPVEGWMRRVNWTAAHNACATVCGPHYLLAVPIDGATENNAVLVYDIQTDAWQSLDRYGEPPPVTPDTEPATRISHYNPRAGTVELHGEALTPAPPVRGLVTTDLWGERTAFLAGAGRMIALGHGTMDRVNGEAREIVSRVTTRGYLRADPRAKRVLSISPVHATQRATLTAEIVTDGVNERQPLFRNRTRDRRRFTLHGRRRFELSNADGRFTAPHREDYALLAGDGLLPREPVPFNLLQTWDAGYPLRATGRWFALRMECRGGRMRLLAVEAEGLPAPRNFRRNIT